MKTGVVSIPGRKQVEQRVVLFLFVLLSSPKGPFSQSWSHNIIIHMMGIAVIIIRPFLKSTIW